MMLMVCVVGGTLKNIYKKVVATCNYVNYVLYLFDYNILVIGNDGDGVYWYAEN